jgi:hypothetical protein
MDVADLLATLSRTHQLEHFEVSYVGSPPGVQERIALSPSAQALVEEALRLRVEEGHPFWHALFLALQRVGSGEYEGLLANADFHQEVAPDQRVSAGSALERSLRKLMASTPDEKILLVSSRVYLQNNSIRHIPMLDFACPPSPRNLSLVRWIAARLLGDAWILESGKSYHAYARELLLSESDLPTYLGRALLYSPLVDGRWVAHQLIEATCRLRISPDRQTGISPLVVSST